MNSGCRIDPRAAVEEGAVLGGNVTVGPFAWIAADTEIGEGCVIGPHAVIHRHTVLGPGCRVHAGAVIGDVPQDLGFEGGTSFVRIGKGCVIREGVTIHRGTREGSATEIGEECFLMANSHVGHNAKLGSRVILANGVLLAGHVHVGDRAFISGNCLVHQFVRIGRCAMMGGGSGVSKDVPPFFTVRPLAVNRVAGVNVVGMRRAGVSPEGRSAVRLAFKKLYRSGLNVSQALAEIRDGLRGPEIDELCEFIASSQRGICGFDARGDSDSEADRAGG